MGVNAMFLMTHTYAELLESTTIQDEVRIILFCDKVRVQNSFYSRLKQNKISLNTKNS